MNEPLEMRPRSVFAQIADIQRLTDEMIEAARRVLAPYGEDLPAALDRLVQFNENNVQRRRVDVEARLERALWKFNAVAQVMGEARAAFPQFAQAASELEVVFYR